MRQILIDKDPLIHFPFYINQYQGILSRYSLEEKGAFISLLCVFLIEDSQLPDNQDQLFRMCLAFTESERKAILSVKEKVIETGLEILKYQKEKREKCRESAKIGGLARVAKAQAIAQETLKRSSSNTEKETEIETEIEIKKKLIKKTKKKPIGFIPPSLQDIQNYCKERNSSVSASKFLDYYSVSEWKDKDGKAVKNWKQKLLSWEGRDATTGSTATPKDSFAESINQQIGQDLVASVIEKPDYVQVTLHSATACDKWMKIPKATRDQIAQQIRDKFNKEPKLKF